MDRKRLVIFRKKILGLNATTLERFVLRVRRLTRLPVIDVLVTTSSDMRRLNRQFRGIDKPTDVLSFPATPFGRPRENRFAGELAISAEIAKENAKRLEHSLSDEVKILTLHGMLHLAGFDHESDEGEMNRKERKLRKQLKLDLALIERTPGDAGSRELKRTNTGRRPSSARKRKSS